MFVGRFAGTLNERESRLSFCRDVTLKKNHVAYHYHPRALVCKPHGSLDWYLRNGKRVQRLMRQMGLIAMAPGPNTSRAHSAHKVYPCGFMFSPPAQANTYDWLASQTARLLGSNGGKGIKIIDFSEVPADVLPVVTGTLARMLYDVQFWITPSKRTPVTLLCDEAHLYLPVRDDADAVQRQALGAFERIAKEGRKYGFSLLVVSPTTFGCKQDDPKSM